MSIAAKETKADKYDAFVADRLARTEARIRLADLAVGVAGGVALTLAYAVLMIVLDGKLVLTPTNRQTALLLFLGGMAWYAWAFVVAPLRLRVNRRYAARQLAATGEGGRSHLVNWVDLEGRDLPPAIRASLAGRTAREVNKTDLDAAVGMGRPYAVAGVAAALLVAFVAVFVAFGPRPFASLLARTFLPFGTAGGIATRTQVEVVRPVGGNATVTIGNPLTVVARLDGRIPRLSDKDAPALLYRHDPSEPWRKRFLMSDEHGHEWSATVGSAEVGNGFAYKVTAGDAETPVYQVGVRAAPLVKEFFATYRHRPYTGKATATRTDRKLEAVKGTAVDILMRASREVTEGTLDLGTGERIRGKLKDGDPRALRFSLVIDEPTTYRLRFTADGEPYIDQASYEIVPLADLAPDVAITAPAKNVTLPIDGRLEVEGEARDDFGLASLELVVRVVDGPTCAPLPYLGGKLGTAEVGTPLRLEYKGAIEPAKLVDEKGKPVELKAGMELEYHLVAKDACDFMTANVSESSPRYRITLSAATNNPQAKKSQQDAEAKRQKAEQERAAELKNEAAERKDKRDREENEERKDAAARDKGGDSKGGDGGRPEKDNKDDKANKGDKDGNGGTKGDEKGGEGSKDKDRADEKVGGKGDKSEERNRDEQTQKQADALAKALQDRENKPESEKGKGGEEKEKKSGENKENKPGEAKDAGENKPGEAKDNGGGMKEQPKGEGKDQGKPDEKGESKPGEPKDSGKDGKDGKGEPKGEGKQSGESKPGDAKGEGKDGGKDGPMGGKPGEAKPAGDKADAKDGKGESKGEGKNEGGKSAGEAKDAPPKPGDKAGEGRDGKSEAKAGEQGKQGEAKPGGEKKDGEGRGEKSAAKEGAQGGEKPSQGKPAGQDPKGAKPGECKECKGDGKSGADGTKPGEGKSGGKTGSGKAEDATPGEVAERKDALGKGGAAGDKARDDLKEMADKAADPQAKQDARKALDEAKAKEGGDKPGTSGKPADPKTVEGKKTENGDGKGGKGEPAEGTAGPKPAAGGKTSGTGGMGATTPTPGANPDGKREGTDDAPPGSAADDPAAKAEKAAKARATMLQLEAFGKRIDPDVLKDAKMSKEDFAKLLRDYAELARRRQVEAAKPDVPPAPGSVKGALPGTGGKVVDPGSPTGEAVRQGIPKPPPEYKDDYTDFLRRLQKPRK